MVRSLFVVPEEVGDEFFLEEVNVSEECVPVVVGELFLDGTIKSFYVCIHPWTLRVGMEVGNTLLLHIVLEVFVKLRAIIGLYVENSEGEYVL